MKNTTDTKQAALRRTAIADAKYGTHAIPMSPDDAPLSFVVVRVRGAFVWVQRSNAIAPEIRLNSTASRLLLAGAYRATADQEGDDETITGEYAADLDEDGNPIPLDEEGAAE